VRDTGVNAPEISPAVRGWQHGGEQARAINSGLVARHAVRLELGLAHRDRWGRLLACAWVRRAKKLVMANAEMVRHGYAQVMTIPPNVEYLELFLKLQREARAVGRGLWGRR
jgi:micrococcal nuclease